MKRVCRLLAIVLIFSGLETISGPTKGRARVFQLAGSVALGSLAAGLTGLATSNQGNTRSTLYSLLAAGFIGGASWFAIPKVRKALGSLEDEYEELKEELEKLKKGYPEFFGPELSNLCFYWLLDKQFFTQFQSFIKSKTDKEMDSWWYKLKNITPLFRSKSVLDKDLYEKISESILEKAERLNKPLDELLKSIDSFIDKCNKEHAVYEGKKKLITESSSPPIDPDKIREAELNKQFKSLSSKQKTLSLVLKAAEALKSEIIFPQRYLKDNNRVVRNLSTRGGNRKMITTLGAPYFETVKYYASTLYDYYRRKDMITPDSGRSMLIDIDTEMENAVEE